MRFEEGIAAALPQPARRTVLVSIFLDGGADSLSMLFPHGDPLYRKLRPRLALPAAVGRPVRRGRPAPLAPVAGAARDAARRRARSPSCPAIGYADADQSHFTSRHFWEVGATSEHLRTGWLGRYLDRVGSPNNPLQGLSLDWRLQPALATAKMPVASIDGPDRYDFWTRNVWGDVENRLLDAIGSLGSIPHGGDAGARTGDGRGPPVGPAPPAAAPFQVEGRQARTSRSPVPYPGGRRRRSRADWPASPRCSAPACRSASSR